MCSSDLMDHMMPDLDGVETTKIIRANGYTMPIIALTANIMKGSREEFLAAGMNDTLTKPVKRELLNQILKDWLPAEKIITSNKTVIGEEETLTGETLEFMRKIENIAGLSVQTGLSRVSGQRKIYEKSLKLAIKEIEKCDKNLKAFLAAADIYNFAIEVHSMKNTLASIGAMELSNLALELETAAYKKDQSFCAANLLCFLQRLDNLKTAIAEAFAGRPQSVQKFDIPPGLLPSLTEIFNLLQNAFKEIDFAAVNEGAEKLDALDLDGALKEEIKKIKAAALIMDYDGAVEIMKNIIGY